VIPGDHGTPAPAFVVHYEALRSQVLGTRPAASRLGLALVLREGLAAWMAAWATCPAPVAPHGAEQSTSQDRIPNALCADVVHVLTSMALSGLQEQSV
jgi:hypothetical protein